MVVSTLSEVGSQAWLHVMGGNIFFSNQFRIFKTSRDLEYAGWALWGHVMIVVFFFCYCFFTFWVSCQADLLWSSRNGLWTTRPFYQREKLHMKMFDSMENWPFNKTHTLYAIRIIVFLNIINKHTLLHTLSITLELLLHCQVACLATDQS